LYCAPPPQYQLTLYQLTQYQLTQAAAGGEWLPTTTRIPQNADRGTFF